MKRLILMLACVIPAHAMGATTKQTCEVDGLCGKHYQDVPPTDTYGMEFDLNNLQTVETGSGQPVFLYVRHEGYSVDPNFWIWQPNGPNNKAALDPCATDWTLPNCQIEPHAFLIGVRRRAMLPIDTVLEIVYAGDNNDTAMNTQKWTTTCQAMPPYGDPEDPSIYTRCRIEEPLGGWDGDGYDVYVMIPDGWQNHNGAGDSYDAFDCNDDGTGRIVSPDNDTLIKWGMSGTPPTQQYFTLGEMCWDSMDHKRVHDVDEEYYGEYRSPFIDNHPNLTGTKWLKVGIFEVVPPGSLP